MFSLMLGFKQVSGDPSPPSLTLLTYINNKIILLVFTLYLLNTIDHSAVGKKNSLDYL